jgi:hypothetical protein
LDYHTGILYTSLDKVSLKWRPSPRENPSHFVVTSAQRAY